MRCRRLAPPHAGADKARGLPPIRRRHRGLARAGVLLAFLSGCRWRAPGKEHVPPAPGAAPAPRAPVVVLYPSASEWWVGTWSRGYAWLLARELNRVVPARAILPVVEERGFVRYPPGEPPPTAQALSSLGATYHARLVASLHIAVAKSGSEALVTMVAVGHGAPLFTRRYPWSVADVRPALDEIFADLARAATSAGAIASAFDRKTAPIWRRTERPEVVDLLAHVMDVREIARAARDRPHAQPPWDAADFLRRMLATDASFVRALRLEDPVMRLDEPIIAERRVEGAIATSNPAPTSNPEHRNSMHSPGQSGLP